MKISKSKRQLAQLLIEAGVTQFPEGANWAAQDKAGSAWCYTEKPKRDGEVWIGSGWRVRKCDSQLANWYQTALSRDEFDQIVAESDGWIEFDGTERPSGYFNKMIDVKLQDGRVMTDSSGRFEWDTSGPSRIVAYRLHKPEPQYCESVTRTTPEPTTPTLDQLLQDWRNADDYAKRKQAEADEAAAMREERWQAVQDRAGEFGVAVGKCGG